MTTWLLHFWDTHPAFQMFAVGTFLIELVMAMLFGKKGWKR